MAEALARHDQILRAAMHRRLGASMSPDELVDFVLDEIAIVSASATATGAVVA